MNWEIDKKINIGNAVTALMIAMSVVWWAAHIEKRVAILEVKTEASSSSIGLYFWCHLKMGGLPNQSQHLTIKSNHFPYFTTGYILIDFECWLSFALLFGVYFATKLYFYLALV